MAEETKVETPKVETPKDTLIPDTPVDREFAPKVETKVETPKVETPKVEPETPKVEPKVEAPTHAPEAIELARTLGIPQEDIDDMTPKELSRSIKHARAFGQQVYEDANARLGKKEEAPPPKAPDDEEVFKKLEEAGAMPELIGLLRAQKAEIVAVREENKKLESLKTTVANNEHQRVRSHVRNLLVEAGVNDEFKGEAELTRVLAALSAQVDFENKTRETVPESVRLDRALAMLGKGRKPKVDPKEVEKQAAFEKHKNEYDAAALSEPTTRKGALSVDEKIDAWQKSQKNRSKLETTVTEDNPVFIPLPG